MTPKEKAKDIIEKVSKFSDYKCDKDLALIVANEVIDDERELFNVHKKISPDCVKITYTESSAFKFWARVKKEIEAL